MTSLTTMFWISKAQILANRDGGQPPIPTTPTFPKPQKHTRDKKWNFMQYCICIYNLTVSILHELSLLKIYTVMNLSDFLMVGQRLARQISCHSLNSIHSQDVDIWNLRKTKTANLLTR